MPFFKTTYNIFTKVDADELFDPNWMDSDTVVLPPYTKWDYARKMEISDVDIWEVIYQASYGIGVYAAWSPQAEFYMVTSQFTSSSNDPSIETFYGPGAYKEVQVKMKELKIPFILNDYWVDPDMMWLYETPKPNTLELP